MVGKSEKEGENGTKKVTRNT